MANIKPAEISAIIKNQLTGSKVGPSLDEVGTVLQVGDGIARVYGLSNVQYGELVQFDNGMEGIVLNLEEDNVGVVLLGPSKEIKEGDTVKRTNRIASINVGEGVVGRVVNTLGQPIDGKGKIEGKMYEMPLERKAPGVIYRQPVNEPLQTGIKSIDAMIPIGRGQRELVIGDRQTGKTTCASGYLIWYAMFHPDSSILIAAHKYQGASDIMSRVRYAYELLPSWIKAGVNSYNRNSIEFDNGSKIMATTTTENTGRGMSLTMIYCDEFAFVQPPEKAVEFWTSLSPTLSTGGKCLITSTPNSDEDQFALIWKEACKRYDDFGNDNVVGTNGFYALKAHWSEHPERDEKWAETEKSRIGEERFRREHDCEFLIFDETLITATKLADLQGEDPVERHGHVRWYKQVEKNKAYVVSLDPSLGTGGDYGAIQVYELPNMSQVAEWQHNSTPIQGQIRLLKQIIEKLSEDLIAKGVSNPEIYRK